MTVFKFTTDCFNSEQNLKKVAEIINQNSDQKPIIVVSDSNTSKKIFFEIADLVQIGTEKTYKAKIQQAQTYFLKINNALFYNNFEFETKTSIEINELFTELNSFIHSQNQNSHNSKSSHSYISNFGEKLFAKLLSNYLNFLGISTLIYYSENTINADLTNENYRIKLSESKKLFKKNGTTSKNKNEIKIFTSQLFSNTDGKILSFDQQNFDYSTCIIASIFNCPAIQIWTDKQNLFSTDSIVSGKNELHNQISYLEAAEFSQFGNFNFDHKVLKFALENKTKVSFKNIFHPDQTICQINFNDNLVPHTVKAVVLKKEVSLITTQDKKIFEYENYLVSSSANGITVVVSKDNLKTITKNIKDAKVENGYCITTVIGEGLKGSLKSTAKILECLSKQKIEPKIILQNSQQISLNLVIKELESNLALQKIYQTILTD
jgi:aspartokinase